MTFWLALLSTAFGGCKFKEVGVGGGSGVWSHDSIYGRYGVYTEAGSLMLDVSFSVPGANEVAIQPGLVKVRLEDGTIIELQVAEGVAPKIQPLSTNFMTYWFLRIPTDEARVAQLASSKIVAAELPTAGQPLSIGQSDLKFEGKQLLKAATCWVERDQ